MEEIFLTLLNTSVTAGYLVLAVLLARIVLKKAPKWISCALWGLVGLRLVLPFSIESALSLIPRRQVVSPEILISATPAIDSGISAVDEAVNPVLAQSLAPTPAATPASAPKGAAGDRIEIKYRDFVLDSNLSAPTMHLNNSPIELTAAVYPLSENAQITWSSGDDTALEVTPNADGSCTVRPLRAVYGGVKLYAECGGVVGECLFYIIE